MPEKRRRATRLTITEPETNQFPDDLSDFPMNDPSINFSNPLDSFDPPDPSSNDHPPSHVANCSVPAFHQLFQMPSKIIESAQNLNLSSNNESIDSADVKFNETLNNYPPESFTAQPPIVPPLNQADCKSSLAVNKKHGYNLGNIYQIAHNKDFDMLDSFLGSLVSMTHIILHDCQMAADPLYLIDGIIKIVSEEVGAAHLNLEDIPSYRSTLKDLKVYFLKT
jgi:hypothetical protein